MTTIQKIAIAYAIIANIVGLSVMGIDKRRAILGGSIGTWAGMYLFRHKTKHWYFVIGMPFILIVQLVLYYYFW